MAIIICKFLISINTQNKKCMARKIFENGDILYAEDVNIIGNPIVDGADFLGHGPKVIDEYLSDAPDNIKTNFYNFYGRLKVTGSTGLSISYNGGPVLLNNGSIVSISSGSLSLPDNSNTFVYINSLGAISSGATLPNESFPIALVTSSSGNITNIADLRDKLVDRVQVSSVPATEAFLPGMGMDFWGTILPNGWLWADGSLYEPADYPNLFAAIGYTYGQSGTKFAVPDKRGRVSVGAGTGVDLTSRSLGQTFGEERVTLTNTEMPSHTHSVTQTPHNHGITQTPHNHGVSDPGHNHTLFSWASGGSDDRVDALNRPGASVAGEVEPGGTYLNNNASGTVLISRSNSGVSVQSSNSNISINNSTIGLTINAQGGNASHNNIQPSISCNYIIKY